MEKIKVLFVCLGNICRSPMAETIFLDIVNKSGRSNEFEIDSAGMLNYHEGEKADYRMRSHAEKHGYNITHLSRPVVSADLDKYDYIVGMDDQNIRSLLDLTQTSEQRAKIVRMTDYLTQYNSNSVPDPYYGGEQGFEYVIELLEDACRGLFDKIIQ